MVKFNQKVLNEIEQILKININDENIEKRLKAILMRNQGISVNEIARQLNTSKSNISKWCKKIGSTNDITILLSNYKGGRPTVDKNKVLLSEDTIPQELEERIKIKMLQTCQLEDDFWDYYYKLLNEKKLTISHICDIVGITMSRFKELKDSSLGTYRILRIKIILALIPEPNELEKLLYLSGIKLRDSGEEGRIKRFYIKLPEIRKIKGHKKCDYSDFNSKYAEQLEKYYISLIESE